MRANYAGVEPGMPPTAVGTGRTEAGVNVVRGGEASVTVHRGGAAEQGEASSMTGTRPAMFAGVRVHRGEDAPMVVDGG